MSGRFRAAAGLASGLLAALTAAPLALAAPDPPGEGKMPPVYLNHVYSVLEPATFGAIERSVELRDEFAQFERRSTHSGDDFWTGIYFYGESTYFEFLQADAERGRPLGATGIALGVETPGGSAAVKAALDAVGLGQAVTVLRPRQVGAKTVPWFFLTAFEPEDPQLVLFTLEYSPEFLKQWSPELSPELSGISRKAVLQRYREKAASILRAKNPLMKDITAVTLALHPNQAEPFGKQLAALGYRSEKRDGRTDWIGPDVRISVVPARAKRQGIVALDFSLERKAPPRVIPLGPGAHLEIRRDAMATMAF